MLLAFVFASAFTFGRSVTASVIFISGMSVRATCRMEHVKRLSVYCTGVGTGADDGHSVVIVVVHSENSVIITPTKIPSVHEKKMKKTVSRFHTNYLSWTGHIFAHSINQLTKFK
jgi:hypothetical protein